MSAPVTDPLSSSISSSGHIDGLGRRALAFDRESGGVLERLHVRPELAVFEQVIRRRVSQVATLEDERFARPLRIERDTNGDLVVVSEFVTGSRLSDLLDVSADSAVVPGVDVALGYLLEALPALVALHTTGRITHGLIDPSRTVLTPTGQVAFLDLGFGPIVEILRLSPDRLWADFGVSTLTSGAPFDAASDITQVAISSLMLVLGRSLRPDEHPEAIAPLLREVIEVAHIRGSTAFATGLERFLQRSLPLPGRRPYESADEALADVRNLVKHEIGLDICKQALVDFIAQMDAAYAASLDADADADDADVDAAAAGARTDTPIVAAAAAVSAADPHEPEFEGIAFTVLDEPELQSSHEAAPVPAQTDHLDDDDDGEELELSLDQPEPAAPVHADEVYDLAASDPSFADPAAVSSELASLGGLASPGELAPPPGPEPTPAVWNPPAPDELPVASGPAAIEGPAAVATPAHPLPEFAPVEPAAAAAPASAVEPPLTAPVPGTPPAPAIEAPASDAATLEAVAAQIASGAAPQPNPELPQPDQNEGGSSRRRKRQQQKSARARKDKLRSTASGEEGRRTPPPPPPPPAEKPATSSGWTVSTPRQAESFALNQPVAPPAPPPARPTPPPMPSVPSFSPTPVGQVPLPTYASPSPGSAYGSPSVVRPATPPPPPTPPAAPQVASGHLKVKSEPPAGFTAKKPITAEPPVLYSGPDRFGTLSLGQSSEDESSRGFPWKLAAVAVVVAIIAIGVGRSYLPGRTAVAGEPGATAEPGTEVTAPAPAPAADKPEGPIAPGRGRISIKTEPAGIKVLLDRKPVGETPLDIEAAPGRRVLTFLTSGGEVMHSVRVVAGKTAVLDVPVFSGWVSVVAPVLLDISENGRSLGTSEQNRLMLPPGRHELTLSNKDLGYSERRDVDIEPGGVRSVTVDPKGVANLNASPWAEVWLDGAKLGDTPLSSVQVPLGLHEFVFKHPQFGERRVSATIRANAPAALSVDFAK